MHSASQSAKQFNMHDVSFTLLRGEHLQVSHPFYETEHIQSSGSLRRSSVWKQVGPWNTASASPGQLRPVHHKRT